MQKTWKKKKRLTIGPDDARRLGSLLNAVLDCDPWPQSDIIINIDL